MANTQTATKKAAAKTTTDILVGIDVGFGVTKYISSAKTKPQYFPSAVMPGSVSRSRLFNLSGIDLNNLIVTTPDGSMYVGNYALSTPDSDNIQKRTRNRDRASDEISRVLFHTGIALSCPDEEGEYNVHIVTGLPNSDYGTTYHDNLQFFLEKSFEVDFHLGVKGTIKKKINVKSVEILRQPEGTVTYNQFLFDPNQFLVASPDAVNSIGIIDIGHYTTDFALFRNGIIVEDDKLNNSTLGCAAVYDRLKETLKYHFNHEYAIIFNPPEREFDRLIRTGTFHYQAQTFDVSEFIQETVHDVVVPITREILQAWGNEANYLEKIIVAGGGSYIFAEALQEQFRLSKKPNVEVVEAAQFTNVMGFYMYGIILMADRISEKEAYENYVKPVFEEVE